MSGSIITLPAVQAAPSGYTLLGSSALIYVNSKKKAMELNVNFYQKD
jgi:hypothetical protein